METDPIEVVAVVKGRERFVFIYRLTQPQDVFAALPRFNNDPSLNFDWWDMVRAAKAVRRRVREHTEASR